MASLSVFYLACANNDVNTVQQKLASMTLDEVNQIELNGSTALHIAASNGNLDIVKLLLEKGAARQIRNKLERTPVDEASMVSIKTLLKRSTSAARYRFVGDEKLQSEWSISGHQSWNAYYNWVHFYGKSDHDMKTVINTIRATNELHGSNGFEQIEWFLKKAEELNNVTYLVKAYTAETDFYKRLNLTLAKDDSILYDDTWTTMFSALIAQDSSLEKLKFLGQTYRGMKVTEDELSKYVIDEEIMNKSLLSTSKDRCIAERFATMDQDSDAKRISVICTYIIIYPVGAIDIETISEYPEEKEVLILPSRLFKIQNISKKQSSTGAITVEIILHEYLDEGFATMMDGCGPRRRRPDPSMPGRVIFCDDNYNC